MSNSMMNVPLTPVHFIERAGELFGYVEIVSRLPGRELHRSTYRDVYDRAWRLAGLLQSLGLERGDRVGTLMWNHYAHLEAYFGIPAAGGVVHTLNLRLHPRDIAHIAAHAKDRIVIVDDVLLPLWEQVAALFKPEKVIVVPLTGKPVASPYENYETAISGTKREVSKFNVDENDAAGLCYTSGTTGNPRGVMYSHRSLALHSIAISLPDVLNLSQNDTVLPVVPMFHANAWGIPFACTMLGIKQVLPGPYLDPASILELLAAERVTFSAGVPTVWMGLLRELDANPRAWKILPGLRTLVGGAAVPEAMIRGFDKHGIHLRQGWGMTETSPLGTVGFLKSHMLDWSDDDKYSVRAKQGLPVPFVEIRTISSDGVCSRDGKTMGELQVRGPWVAASYFQSPVDSDKWTEDGWFCTGDVATIDGEGYMQITDRTKDLIKSGGEWISSVDLENSLMAHPAVQEAAVIAVPHPKWQERPLAVVVLKDSVTAGSDELLAYLAARFPKWCLPEDVVFTKEIPRTSTGKFLKTKLREQFRDWKGSK